MNLLKEKFQSLNEREQKLVLLSGIFILFAIFYFALWQPLNASLKEEETRYANQQALLNWVEESAIRARQLRGATSTAQFNGSLPQAVNTTSAAFNIPISRMQPQGEEIQVLVDLAAFNDVLAWLQELEEMGIHILQADIAESDASGMVKIRRLQLGKA